MGAAFGAANEFTKPPNTLFANFANLNDNASASRAYILCYSVFLSLTNEPLAKLQKTKIAKVLPLVLRRDFLKNCQQASFLAETAKNHSPNEF